MADSRLLDLGSIGVPDDADLLYAVDVSASAPRDRKLSVAGLRAAIATVLPDSPKRMLGESSSATPIELLDENSLRFAIAEATTIAFQLFAVARRTDVVGESAAWLIEGVIDRNSGTVALVDATNDTVYAADQPWTLVASADNVNKALVFTFTGQAAKTINVVGSLAYVAVVG